ncbi:MAG: DNA polymerase III subunit delta [Chloroflexi bacterium]|nr:DNA polymerase III subunit delta [Chloroflexota bacterium]MCI0576664.1 DNA polymerase III subunit delta [Chloroflexota bacterium]MCI0647977.1 DNA polymerase III subunit delta [Chloroflexota bacterium]MCI0726813.1 DNA polymerase III subunit delta [Chloroflexota bacterium]
MFYVFHGDDEHSQKETLAELQRKLGDPAMLELNTARFEGQGVSFSELRHACDSIPFLADKRLVIVANLLSQTPPFLDELLAYLPDLPETTRLVFLESKTLPAAHPILKLAEKSGQGYAKAFARPEGSELERWIRQRVKTAGGHIAPQAVQLLALNAGNDLRLLDNEIEKLVLYKGGETIEAQDVTLLCPYVAEASVFDLVDALGSRNGRTAAQLLHKKTLEGADPFFLFSMFVRQFRLLIQVKELAEEGRRPAEIAKALAIRDFVAGKLHQQSQHFTLLQLEQIYAHLLEIDVAVKTGRTDMPTALDLLVAGLASQ